MGGEGRGGEGERGGTFVCGPAEFDDEVDATALVGLTTVGVQRDTLHGREGRGEVRRDWGMGRTETTC
jgi:hypothetical protein